jgi:hypothetical protein
LVPVSLLVITSFAPGTEAPLASVIVPLKEPVATWPKARPQLSTSPINHVVIFVRVISPLIIGSQLYDFS